MNREEKERANEMLREEYHQILVRWRIALQAGNIEGARVLQSMLLMIKTLIEK